MTLSACIVVYNGYDEVLKAAQTVLQFTRRYPLTLYLVDNASPDGSGQCLAKAAKDGTLHIREDQKVEVLCRTKRTAALAPATTPSCRSLPAPTTSSSTRISSSWPIPSVTWPTGWPGTRMP